MTRDELRLRNRILQVAMRKLDVAQYEMGSWSVSEIHHCWPVVIAGRATVVYPYDL